MSTTTIELQPVIERDDFGPAPSATVARAKQRWNEPAINKWRLAATFASFALVGASDGVYGALVPYIRPDYNLSTTVTSLIFVTPFVGYTIATAIVNTVHMRLGQRGIAIIGPLCHIVPFVIMAAHPPYVVMLVAYVIVGLGNGLVDAAWNAWAADMVGANALVGLLGAFYGIGATLSPLIATQMINAGLRWNMFYYTLVGGAVFELATSAVAFWRASAEEYRLHNAAEAQEKSRTWEAAKAPATLLMSLFLFIYMGVEVSVGGWIVEFMIQVRHGSEYESGLIPTGFWAGVTVGRIALGFANEWLGERIAVAGYLALSVAVQLVFWLVPKFVVSAVTVSILGFLTGPLFPAAIVVAAKLLPKHLHTPGIGIASAFAGSGAAILPFVGGAILGKTGIESLQPFVLSMLAALLAIWFLLPKSKEHEN